VEFEWSRGHEAVNFYILCSKDSWGIFCTRGSLVLVLEGAPTTVVLVHCTGG
jgi:hypothetical protein